MNLFSVSPYALNRPKGGSMVLRSDLWLNEEVMFGFILNIPYTLIGILVALISMPSSISFRMNPYTFVVKVKNFWWVLGYMRNARAMAIGHVVLLGPKLEDRDLEHELVHVRQHQKMPLIQPILYYIELLRKGYKNNIYEIEAYRIAGNIYKDNEKKYEWNEGWKRL